MCPGCGYDLAGARAACPECGRAILDEDRSAAETRIALVAAAPHLLRRLVLSTFVCGGILGLLVGVLAGSLEPGFVVHLAAFLILIGAIAAGYLSSLTLPTHFRAAHGAAWLSGLWLLNLPWLSVLGFAAVPCLLGVLIGDGAVVSLASYLCMFLWLAIIAVALARWSDQWTRHGHSTAIPESAVHRAGTLSAALLVWFASATLGVFASVIIVEGADALSR